MKPIDIPPSGSPLTGLSPLLGEIAARSQADDIPPSGVFGAGGLLAAPGPRVSIGLFQLTSEFQNGTPSPDWTTAPNDDWYWATATRVEYYPATAEWKTPAAEGDSATTPEEVTVWAPVAMIQANAGVNGETVWCFYDEGPGAWVVLAQGPPRWSSYGTYSNPASAALPAGGGFTELTGLSATLPRAGKYLVVFTLSLDQNVAGAGPLICSFMASLFVNHILASAANSVYGHFHCPQSATPASGVPPWVVTIPAGAIDGTHPAAPVILPLPQVGSYPTDSYYSGQVSWCGVIEGNAGDVLTIGAESFDCPAFVTEETLAVVLLGP